MDPAIRAKLDDLYAQDRVRQTNAYLYILSVTDSPVDWAYDAWDEMLANLRHKDNHVRSIAAQVLCNLAKSDPQKRILQDFDALLAVTKDERFVTARHCLQALWKVGAAGKPQQDMVVEGLARRFGECLTEKNGTLMRYDIIQGLRHLYDVVKDEAIKRKALTLIETEADAKYRKKYATVWRGMK